MRTNLTKLLCLGFLFAFAVSCKKETVNNPVFYIRGNANGAQETPSRVTTTATGTLTGTYNKDNNTMQYNISWTGLTGGNITGMHFHGPADPGVGAGIIVPISGFTATATSGTISGTATLTDNQETDFMNGLWYYNIHTATYPSGEIRGQVFVTQ